jgi:hypothetical protein
MATLRVSASSFSETRSTLMPEIGAICGAYGSWSFASFPDDRDAGLPRLGHGLANHTGQRRSVR